MANLPLTNAETLALLARLDARQDKPGVYEWSRINGTLVQVEVSPTGVIRTWENGAAHAPVEAGSFALACEAVEDVMRQDTTPREARG
jgi:hypothetical protein